MTKFPTKYNNEYHLSDVFISSIDGGPRGTGADGSESEFILYIGSAPIERMVALKGFISSLSLSFFKNKQEGRISNQEDIYIAEKEGSLSYDITIDMPAHSVNESKNNLAKIEELQRYTMKGTRWNIGAVMQEITTSRVEYVLDEYGNPTNQIRTIDETEEIPIGFSYDYVTEKYNTTVPLFFVFFSNLVNGGKKFKSNKILSFDDLGSKGFPCYIESIKYEPDIDAGFFEFDKFLYPKNIKLNLKLNYESETLFDSSSNIINNKTILPFTLNSEIAQYDSGLFPFHVDMSMKNMNQLDNTSVKMRKDSFLFIASSKNIYEFNKISNKLTTKDSMPRYVMFDLFLKEFSRDLKTKFAKADPTNHSVFSRVKPDLNQFMGIKYSLEIDVPSANLLDAKKNAAKIQYLSRMFFKTFYDGSEQVSSDQKQGILTDEDVLNNVLVYIPSMIERPTGKKSIITSPENIVEVALPLFLDELSFNIDHDLGYFVENGMLYPKSYSLKLSFTYTKSDLILNYDYMITDEDNYKLKPKPDSNIITKENAHFFPYNRKTVKIGGR